MKKLERHRDSKKSHGALVRTGPRQFCEWNSKSSGKCSNDGDGGRAVPDVVFALSLCGEPGAGVVAVPVSAADP